MANYLISILVYLLCQPREDLSKSIPAHKFLRVEHTIFYLFSWLSIYCSKLFVCSKLQKHLTLGLAWHYTKFSSSKTTFNCKDLLASDNHLFLKVTQRNSSFPLPKYINPTLYFSNSSFSWPIYPDQWPTDF